MIRLFEEWIYESDKSTEDKMIHDAYNIVSLFLRKNKIDTQADAEAKMDEIEKLLKPEQKEYLYGCIAAYYNEDDEFNGVPLEDMIRQLG